MAPTEKKFAQPWVRLLLPCRKYGKRCQTRHQAVSVLRVRSTWLTRSLVTARRARQDAKRKPSHLMGLQIFTCAFDVTRPEANIRDIYSAGANQNSVDDGEDVPWWAEFDKTYEYQKKAEVRPTTCQWLCDRLPTFSLPTCLCRPRPRLKLLRRRKTNKLLCPSSLVVSTWCQSRSRGACLAVNERSTVDEQFARIRSTVQTQRGFITWLQPHHIAWGSC